MSFCSQAQNLVPNPSFEIYDTCPDRLSQIGRAIGWYVMLNTPDYFNECAVGPVSVPNNFAGFQAPEIITDKGYAGLYLGAGKGFQYREWLGININRTLEIGTRYFFSLRFSAGHNTYIECYLNKLGMKMLTFKPDTFGLQNSLLNNSAILYENSIITDTSNWHLFSGSFIADSAYNFLLIGNFFDSLNLDKVCYDTVNMFSYVYIDNVCLSENWPDCDDKINQDIDCGFTLYPSVGNGYLSIEPICGNSNIYCDLKIFDCLGRLIMTKKSEGGNLKLDITSFSNGVYFIAIEKYVFKIIKI